MDEWAVPVCSWQPSYGCVMCHGVTDGGLCSCDATRKGISREPSPTIRHVSFAEVHETFMFERAAFIDLVGDARDPQNPNYCALGVSRDLRLTQFASAWAESHFFEQWRAATMSARANRAGAQLARLGADATDLNVCVRATAASAGASRAGAELARGQAEMCSSDMRAPSALTMLT